MRILIRISEISILFSSHFQKQENDIKRMIRRKCDDAEINKAAALDDSTRKTELESNFQQLLAHYQVVLARLDKHGS